MSALLFFNLVGPTKAFGGFHIPKVTPTPGLQSNSGEGLFAQAGAGGAGWLCNFHHGAHTCGLPGRALFFSTLREGERRWRGL